MAQNYSTKVLNKIDERNYQEAVCGDVINKGMRLEFNGNNSVTFYNVDVVAENDYVRSGTNRFGALVELGTGVETKTLSQDKGWTFTVDRGNLSDSEMVQEANKSVKRQIREVSVPNTDIYNLATATSYAVSASQTTGSITLTKTNAYENFLIGSAFLFNAKVRGKNVCFLGTTAHNLLKRDAEFVRDCDTTYKDLKKGIIGMVDGIELRLVPTGYLASGVHFLFLNEKVLIAPMKFNSVRVLTDVQGIDGSVAEGRRYHDCFIPANKGVGVYTITT